MSTVSRQLQEEKKEKVEKKEKSGFSVTAIEDSWRVHTVLRAHTTHCINMQCTALVVGVETKCVPTPGLHWSVQGLSVLKTKQCTVNTAQRLAVLRWLYVDANAVVTGRADLGALCSKHQVLQHQSLHNWLYLQLVKPCKCEYCPTAKNATELTSLACASRLSFTLA